MNFTPKSGSLGRVVDVSKARTFRRMYEHADFQVLLYVARKHVAIFIAEHLVFNIARVEKNIFAGYQFFFVKVYCPGIWVSGFSFQQVLNQDN